MTKKQTLARYLDISLKDLEVSTYDKDTFIINPHEKKQGNSPKYYQETITDLKKILSNSSKARISRIINNNTRLNLRQKAYNKIELEVRDKPIIKDWLYNSNILFFLLGLNPLENVDTIRQLRKAWKNEVIEDNRKLTSVNNGEYLVLTDKEADRKAREYILDTVWAFNTDFIIAHSRILDYDEASESIVKTIAEKCESGNEAMKKLINNLDEFVNDAINADGRGHFIDSYDGVEIEEKEYFVYKMN